MEVSRGYSPSTAFTNIMKMDKTHVWKRNKLTGPEWTGLESGGRRSRTDDPLLAKQML